MFICAAWKIVDGPMHRHRTLVFRCDLDEGHEGDHIDNVLLVNWPDSESEPEYQPRNEWNAPRAAGLVKLVQTQQFELARTIKERNHAIATESQFAKGQTVRTPSGALYKLTKVGGGIHACPPYGPMVILVGYRLDDEKQIPQQIAYHDMEGYPPTIVPEPLEDDSVAVASEAA
jgi:hypothetical protein